MADDEVYEPFAVTDTFCEALVRVERIGSCRRLVFVVNDRHTPGGPTRPVVAKLIVPQEMVAEIAQKLAADQHDPGGTAAFARIPLDAVAN